MIEIPPLFAHRGCSIRAPENTISAFKLAEELGVCGIELDVHLALSGEPVVIHDENLLRTGRIDRAVDTIDLRELSTIDIGSWFGDEYCNERIPTLSQVFESIGPSVFFDVELKSQTNENWRLVSAVAEEIRRHNVAGRCVISSFNPYAIRAFHRVEPDIPVGLIYANLPAVPRYLRRGQGGVFTKCSLVKPHFKQTGKLALAFQQRIRRRRVAAWTVDSIEDAKRLFDSGVDSIISNQPEELLSLVD